MKLLLLFLTMVVVVLATNAENKRGIIQKRQPFLARLRREDPCIPNPCGENGYCTYLTEDPYYACGCYPPYVGASCEKVCPSEKCKDIKRNTFQDWGDRQYSSAADPNPWFQHCSKGMNDYFDCLNKSIADNSVCVCGEDLVYKAYSELDGGRMGQLVTCGVGICPKPILDCRRKIDAMYPAIYQTPNAPDAQSKIDAAYDCLDQIVNGEHAFKREVIYACFNFQYDMVYPDMKKNIWESIAKGCLAENLKFDCTYPDVWNKACEIDDDPSMIDDYISCVKTQLESGAMGDQCKGMAASEPAYQMLTLGNARYNCNYQTRVKASLSKCGAKRRGSEKKDSELVSLLKKMLNEN